MKLLTTTEAAKIISELTGKPMSVRQVRHEILIGKLKAHKIGHSYAIEEHVLKNYKRRHPGPATES